MKHKYMGLAIILLVLALPVPVYADLIYPSFSYNTFVDSEESKNLINVGAPESENYTMICRNNGTNVHLIIEYYNHSSLVLQEIFNIFNFSLFSFRLLPYITDFKIDVNNSGFEQVKIYLDVYPISLSDLNDNNLVLFPIDNPTIEYVEVPVYVPVIVQQNTTEYIVMYENITVYETVTEFVERVEYLIEIVPAILAAIGGISVLIVYIAVRTKKEKEKPINKLTLDDLLEEFRKGN